MDNLIRSHLIISGQVQGVFYRRSAKLRADELKVYGWVKNVSEGNVELMVQGAKFKVEEFVKWCRKGPPFAEVVNIEVKELKGLEDFSEFSIV